MMMFSAYGSCNACIMADSSTRRGKESKDANSPKHTSE